MSSERFGFELPILMATAFRALVDALHEDLATRGHPDARPLHGFALQAVGWDGCTASQLGQRLGVSKQAAAKTTAALERLGYVTRRRDPADARAMWIERTPKGQEMLELSATTFARLRAAWVESLGGDRVRALEDDLERIAGESASAKIGDLPGWLR